MRTFILQKHISTPRERINCGSLFIKTHYTKDSPYTCNNYALHPDYVEGNTEWFKEKEPDPIQDAINLLQKEGFGIVPLNFDSKTKMFSRGFPLYYTEDDMKKCFNESRGETNKEVGRIEYNDGDWRPLGENKYKTFEDYLKSIK